MSKNSKKQQRQKPAAKPATREELTVDSVAATTSQSEFNRKKQLLINELISDVNNLTTQKNTLLDEIKDAQNKSDVLRPQIEELEHRKTQLQTDCKEIEVEYHDAMETINNADSKAAGIVNIANAEAENIRKEADDAAQTIREDAEKERTKTLLKAAEEAREAFKNQTESILNQINDIAKREKKLLDDKLSFQKQEQDFEFEKEALQEMTAHVNNLKERYKESNPTKLEELNLQLRSEEAKYQMLLGNYTSLSKKLEEMQVLLDTVKTEIEDSTGGKKVASMRELVGSLQEFKEKYENLAAVYEKYPDDASISLLEERARKVDKLERENEALELERNRYREEAAAAKNTSRELEVVRQEVEATNALNEHLLQELESHKTALESRTGDTCPSLSKVDAEVEEQDFEKDINTRFQRNTFTSLEEIVLHIKNYAGSRIKEERLYYTDDDIRAFLAGMAVSRLIILQGMSGTGKSSLPRIFSEAISGFNRLIPVESSWRDRNELLGYYNDFNKKFNAKSFTIELYRSCKKRCQQIPTFIVLDEMNLARIEYYFSDFLAILQEPDHEKWLIELVSSDMRTLPMELPETVKRAMQKENPSIYAIWEKIERSRQGDLKSETSDEEKEELTAYLAKIGKLTGAKDLIAGRKIKVTDNIWFIGTANQDESTFEISDKVYDRAQVVSLNRKGVAEGKYPATDKKFISVDDLLSLFENAIAVSKCKDSVDDKLDKIDSVLIEYFDTSFGNRIVTQTEDFAAVFTAAGGELDDALDYQISTKIIRKIISSDDEEALMELLGVTGAYKETQRLLNKRIKELTK